MSTVNVFAHSNIHIRVDAERSVLSELNEYFAHYADGYRFHPLFKQRRWDGKVRQFNVNTGMIYRGLADRIVEFCNDRGYSYDIDPSILDVSDIELSDTQSFIDGLGFAAKGNPISPRDYQVDATHHCMKSKRSLVQSPTSSGKSLIIAAIARYLQIQFAESGKKTLIIVPNVSLVNQFAYDLCDYFSRDIEWLKGDPVHCISAGKEKDSDSPIFISTYQSLMKIPKTYFDQFRCVIVDECHGAEAKALRKVIDNCTHADYRFGFTGSLKTSKTHILALEGMFGRTFTTTTTRELMDTDQVTELDIKALVIRYPEEFSQKMRKVSDYQTEVDFVVGNEKRNRFLAKLALSQPGNGLILVNLVEKHAKPLLKILKELAGDRPVFYISGEVKGDKREEIRQRMDTETNAIIVSNYQCLSTGVNIPSLHWLVFGSSMKSSVKVIQSIGRVIRKHKSKSRVTVFDVVDDMRCRKRGGSIHENYLFKHFSERLGIYTDQKFDCEIKKIPLFVKES